MNAEIFASSITSLLFGVAVGASVQGLLDYIQIQKLNDSLQNAIDIVIQRDETIDELKEELDDLKKGFNKLQRAAEVSVRALDSIRNMTDLTSEPDSTD